MDAAADSASDGSPAGGVVTMTVQRDDAPDVGVPVVFLASDGTAIATVMTDGSGVATAAMPQGGSVTVIQTMPDVISTYIGVAPTDALTLTDYRGAEPTQTVNVTSPTEMGANGYTYNFACGGPFNAAQVTLPHDCGASDDVLVRATNGTDYIGAFVAFDVPIANQAMSIAGTYIPMTSQTFAVTNAGATTSVTFSAWVAGSHGVMNYRNGAIPISAGSGSGSTTEGFVADGVNQAVMISAQIPTATGMFTQTVTSIAPSSASSTVDLGSLYLPSMTSPPSYDIAGHAVSWQSAGGAQMPDMTLATLLMTRDTHVWQWNIAAPYTAGELRLPTLPVLGFDYNPQAADSIAIELGQAHVPGGYAAARPNILSTIDDPTVGGTLFPFHIDTTTPSQSVTSLWLNH